MNKDKNEKEELEEEWTGLVLHAQQGISPEEIRR
ncbi:protein sinI, partial [Bacillus haynesii]|nr:protein sinI [Bacillus haynesii]